MTLTKHLLDGVKNELLAMGKCSQTWFKQEDNTHKTERIIK